MSTITRVRSGSTIGNQARSATIKRPSLINLSRMLEGEIVRHYDRFVAEGLNIRLLGQYDNYADFIFMTSSSQKGMTPIGCEYAGNITLVPLLQMVLALALNTAM